MQTNLKLWPDANQGTTYAEGFSQCVRSVLDTLSTRREFWGSRARQKAVCSMFITLATVRRLRCEVIR